MTKEVAVSCTSFDFLPISGIVVCQKLAVSCLVIDLISFLFRGIVV